MLKRAIENLRKALNRQTAGLKRVCEFLLTHWPLYVLNGLLFLALCLGPLVFPMMKQPYAPSWWWTLLTGLTALPVMLGLVYMLHPIPPSPGWRFSQQPLSDLGDAQLVMVDTSLLTDGQRETLIALPLDQPAEPRRRPDALTLAAAMIYTASLQSDDVRPVLLEAARALGLNADHLLRYHPVTGETSLDACPGVVAKDGKRQAAYFAGDPLALARLCGNILDGSVRPMTPDEFARVAAVSEALTRQGALTLGFATLDGASGQPLYLGLFSMRDVVSPDAELAVQALLDAGYEVMTQPIDERFAPPMRLSALRQRLGLTGLLYAPQVILSTTLLDTSVMCIAAADHRHRRFDLPLLLAREWFGQMTAWLRLALGMALPLLLCCAAGPAHPLYCLAVIAPLTIALCASAADDRLWDAGGATLLAVGAALRIFLILAAPVGAGSVMGLYAVTAATTVALHLSRRWRTTALTTSAGVLALLLGWLIPRLPALSALLALLTGCLAGILAGQKLRRAIPRPTDKER